MKVFRKFIIGIAALAAFGISQTSFAGAQKVIVNNGASNPVPVTVQGANNSLPVTVQGGVAATTVAGDNPAFHPYARDAGHDVTAASDTLSFDVPAGKVLVLELVTFQANLPSGQNLDRIDLNVQTGGGSFEHKLMVTQRGSSDDPILYATQPLRLYADPGTGTVSFFVSRGTTTGTFSWHVSISGYLVDAPAP